MKKVAVLIENLFNEKELLYPYYRLLEEGYEVHLVGTEKNAMYEGQNGLKEFSSHASRDISADDYAGVVIPGGFSPDYMRRSEDTINFVKDLDKQNKPIAAICHGGWMLVSSVDLKDKNVTSYFSIKDDLSYAGANWKNEEVVVDGNLITSRNPDDLPAFMKALIKELE